MFLTLVTRGVLNVRFVVMRPTPFVWLAALGCCLALGACTDDGPGVAGPSDALPTENGCPTYPGLVALPGDDIGGDTYESFAQPFFAEYCLFCHDSSKTTNQERHGAPEGANWDEEESVRSRLGTIRNHIAVINDMPYDVPDLTDQPKPTCEERFRIARWIDANAP